MIRLRRGRGVRREPGVMNGLEREYANTVLEPRRIAGEILEWHFEAVKFKLAPKTFLTIDFMVMLADNTIEFHDTKGFMEDDAAVKIKVAAEKYPFRFLLIFKRPKKEGGGWKIVEV